MKSIILPILILALATISVVPPLVSIKERRFDFFEPINFVIFSIIITVYSFIYQIYLTNEELKYQSQISWNFEQGMTILLTLFILFYLSIIIGYYARTPSSLTHRVNRRIQFGKTKLELHKYAFLYIFLGLSFYILLVNDALRGDPLLIFRTSEPRSEMFVGAYHLRLGAQMLHIGYFLWIVSTINKGRSPGVLQLALFMPVVFLFLLLGGRSGALSLIIAFVVLLYYVWVENLIIINRRFFKLPNDKFHKTFKLAVIPALGILVAVLSTLLRYSRRGWSIERTLSEIEVARILTLNNTEIFANLLLLLDHSPEEIGFYFGGYYIRPLLNFIPRAFWESKPPLDIGTDLRETVFPDGSGGIPPGTVGELYVNFGYPTIIVGGLILGVFLRLLYNTLRENSSSPFFLYIYSYTLVNFAPSGLFSNNSLFSVFSFFLLLSPVLIVHFSSRLEVIGASSHS